MLRYRRLSPELWPDLERLFGPRGACGGCWCMWWRVARGGQLWEQTKGETAHRQLKKLVVGGQARGILAYRDDEPVGWCSHGPRVDFPRLETVKAYRRDDAQRVWCVNCFFIPRAERGQGLATGLLQAALEAMRDEGAAVVEAYPVLDTAAGKRQADAFAWTGPLVLFERAGFVEVQRLSPRKPLLRLTLAS
ncbi:MAG: GNAT family N-acetyltransferase [Pseudomonadota bacterium]